jgi:hypothetical protein
MTKLILGCVGVVGLFAGSAAGQGPVVRPTPVAPAYRPPVSPYLNLTRQGSLASNYYNLVRPQVEFGNAIQGLQQQVALNRQNITTLEQGGNAPLPVTGHATQFLNLGGYFLNAGGGAGGQGTAARRTTAPTAQPAAATRSARTAAPRR